MNLHAAKILLESERAKNRFLLDTIDEIKRLRSERTRLLTELALLDPGDNWQCHVITCQVASAFSLTEDALLADTRVERIVVPRMLAMYLARKLTPFSQNEIARAFQGSRARAFDHATLVHACRNIEDRMETQPLFAKRVGRIRAEIEICLSGIEELKLLPALS